MTSSFLRPPDARWARSTITSLKWVSGLAAAIFVAGLFIAPQRSWSGFLIGFMALTGLALAGPVGLAFLSLSGARWSRRLESVPRAMARALPAAAVMGLVLVAGVHSLYEWSHSAIVDIDPILTAKSSYLNAPFFSVRLVVFFTVWLLATRALVRVSEQSRDDAPGDRHRRLRTAAIFVLLFAPTWSLASIDWLQSLDPHWFSTIYALVTLAGLGVAGMAAAIVLVVAADRRGEVTAAQYGDLGALLMSLCLFWGYIWYSQYLLVWYTNLPEETPWYIARLSNEWGLLTKLSCLLCSALPFALLLFRRLRRSRTALVRISVLVLIGRLVDLYVLAGPPLMGETPRAGVWELAPVVGLVALFFLVAIEGLRRTAMGATRPSPPSVATAASAAAPSAAPSSAAVPAA